MTQFNWFPGSTWKLISRNSASLGKLENLKIFTNKLSRQVADNFKNTMKIVFDEYLPKWNYRVVPLSIKGSTGFNYWFVVEL
jgi:hypothetical protein